MKTTILFLSLSLCITMLMGCASPNMRYSNIATASVQPDDSHALVYFIRPKKAGYNAHAAVYDDHAFIGFVPYSTKLPYVTTPGEHLFMVVSESADFLKADLEAGKTYYIQVVPRLGAWRARFSLAPITKKTLSTAQSREWIEQATEITNKSDADLWAEKNSGSVDNKREAYLAKWLSKSEEDRPYLAPTDCK